MPAGMSGFQHFFATFKKNIIVRGLRAIFLEEAVLLALSNGRFVGCLKASELSSFSPTPLPTSTGFLPQQLEPLFLRTPHLLFSELSCYRRVALNSQVEPRMNHPEDNCPRLLPFPPENFCRLGAGFPHAFPSPTTTFSTFCLLPRGRSLLPLPGSQDRPLRKHWPPFIRIGPGVSFPQHWYSNSAVPGSGFRGHSTFGRSLALECAPTPSRWPSR